MINMGAPGGEESNFSNVLGLLNDENEYAKKLKELLTKAEDARRMQAEANENVKKAENERKLAQELADSAAKKLAQAEKLNADAMRIGAQTEHAKQVLTTDRAALNKEKREFAASKQAEMEAARKQAIDEANAGLAAELAQKRAAAEADAAQHIKDAQQRADTIAGQANALFARAEAQAREADRLKQDAEQRKQALQAKAAQIAELAKTLK